MPTNLLSKLPVLLGASVLLTSPLFAQQGTLFGLGDDRFGALITNNVYRSTSPVQVAANINHISAGSNYSLIVDRGGLAYGAGSNNLFQLGIDSGDIVADFSDGFITTGITNVSAGSNHSLMIDTAGNLLAMGGSFIGQLGNDRLNFPAETPELITTGVVAISAGNNFTLFLKNDDSMWGTGSNAYGQLGLPDTANTTLPAALTTGVSKIAAGSRQSFFIKTDGTLWGMGANNLGQLGDGTNVNRLSAVQIASDVTEVSTSPDHTLFIKTDGSLWGMGWNFNGRLGLGGNEIVTTPLKLMDGVAQVATGAAFSLIVKQDGSVWGTGENFSGQLGLGETGSSFGFRHIMDEGQAISAGDSHSLVLKTDLTVWAMGDSPLGQLGSGLEAGHPTPVELGTNVVDASSASGSTLFVKVDGSLWGAGRNTNGMLGLGQINFNNYVYPSREIAQQVRSVSATANHTLFVKHDDTLWGMGTNNFGQLGLGHTSNLSTPEQIDSNVRMAWASHTGASFWVKNDNTLWVSGTNSTNHFGPDFQSSLVPIQIASDIDSVVNRASTTLYRKTDGSLWGMGSSGFKNLGPTELITLPLTKLADSVVEFTTSAGTTYYTTADRKLWGLGLNAQGQLGQDPSLDKIEEAVLVDTDVVTVSGGWNFVSYIKSDGSLWGLGQNNYGQIGDHPRASNAEPRLIAENVREVFSGDGQTLYTQSASSSGTESYLTNLSTRVKIPDNGEGRLVAGFVISGTEPLTALIRAVGPGLAEFGVDGTMPDPSLQVFNSTGDLLTSNDNWSSGDTSATTEISTVSAELGAFGLTAESLDAALLVTLPPGAYTAQVVRGNKPGGVVLVEVYKRNPANSETRLVNLSVRTEAGSGADTLTAGFVIAGERDQSLLVRAVGPSLANFGVTDFLEDPELAVLLGNETVATNDNWDGSATVLNQSEDLGAFALSETTSLDAATVVELSPGAYTTQVRTKDGASGNTLVEIYSIDQ